MRSIGQLRHFCQSNPIQSNALREMQKRDNAYNNKNADTHRGGERAENAERLCICVLLEEFQLAVRFCTHAHIFVHLHLFHLSHSLLSTPHLRFFYCICLHRRYVHVRANEFVSNNSFQKQNHSRKVEFTMIYSLRRKVFCSVLTHCNDGVLSLLVLHLSVRLDIRTFDHCQLKLFIKLQLFSLLRALFRAVTS